MAEAAARVLRPDAVRVVVCVLEAVFTLDFACFGEEDERIEADDLVLGVAEDALRTGRELDDVLVDRFCTMRCFSIILLSQCLSFKLNTSMYIINGHAG